MIEYKFNKKEYVITLLDAYFRTILANKEYIRDNFTPCEVLWHFPLNLLDDIENKILMGPEPDAKREKMKEKIGDSIKLTRKKIKSFEDTQK